MKNKAQYEQAQCSQTYNIKPDADDKTLRQKYLPILLGS
jgi:hypothetical protein